MKVNFLAPINNTSYGLGANYFLMNMIKQSVDVSLFPIGQPMMAYPQFGPFVQMGLESSKKFDKNSISLRKFHPHAMAERVGKIAIGYTVFELETLKPEEINSLASLDVIISPTKWQDDVIKNNLKDKCPKTEVVHLGVDTDFFRPMRGGNENKPFIFLSIGKFEERKNQKMLLKAFDKAFHPSDDVELHMMCGWLNQDIQKRMEPEISKSINDMNLGYKVKLYNPEFVPLEYMPNIYNNADCFVLPTHAEGFGLPILESMACGKNIITTNVTGQTEYLTKDCGLLLESTGKTKAYDGMYFDGSSEWDTFSFDQLVCHLRYAYFNWKGATNFGNIQIAQQYSWSKVTSELINILRKYE